MGDGEEGLRVQRRQLPKERGRAQERPRASLDIRIQSPQEGLLHHRRKEPQLYAEAAAGRSPGRQAGVCLGDGAVSPEALAALRPRVPDGLCSPSPWPGLYPLSHLHSGFAALPPHAPHRAPAGGQGVQITRLPRGKLYSFSAAETGQRPGRDQTGCLQNH